MSIKSELKADLLSEIKEEDLKVLFKAVNIFLMI